MRKIFLWSVIYPPTKGDTRAAIVLSKENYELIIELGINLIYQEENISHFTVLYYKTEDNPIEIDFEKNTFLTDAPISTLCKLQLLLD